MIQVEEVRSASEIKRFVRVQFDVIGDNPNWAPPLISDEADTLNPEINPVFNSVEAHYFIASRGGKPVGRIAAIINRHEVQEQGVPKMRFGWFDVVDDLQVTEALIARVEEVARDHGLEYLEGPVGFSTMDKAGMLVEGYDRMNTMITWYSLPHYQQHLLELGFAPEKEWVEYQIRIPEEGPSEKVRRFSRLIRDRYDLQVTRFSGKREILDHAEEIFELVNQTYSGLSTYVPITGEEVEYYKKKYFRYLHPDFINCISDSEGKIVAFAITMPSFAKALHRADGRLFPLGWFHLLKARYLHDRAAFYLIGIRPEYRNKGLTAIIFKEMNEVFNRRGIREVETNPELVENKAIRGLWDRYDNEQHKRRMTFRRPVSSP